jgi:hypothetical protein
MMITVSDPMTRAEAGALASSVLSLRDAHGSQSAAVDYAREVAATARQTFARRLVSISPHDLSRLTRNLVRAVPWAGISASAASHIRGEIVAAIAAEQPAPEPVEPFALGRVTGHSDRWLWYNRDWIDEDSNAA